MGIYEYKSVPDSMADRLEKIKAEQYAEWRERAIGQFVSDHSGGRKCDQNATEMRPSFISDHSGGANKMVDVRGKDNNVSTNIDLEALEPCEVCNGKKTLYQHTNSTKLFMNTFGEASTLVTECMACPPYADCCMKGISANSAFKINFCPECGRPLTPEARAMLEKRLRG